MNLSRSGSDLKVRGLDAVETLWFDSSVWRGQPVRIFAYAAIQGDAAEAPTVIMVHGGGGLAESLLNSRSHLYAAAGFNIISLDLPGKGDSRAGSRSTGPDMMYANLFWKGDDLHDAWLYHAVIAVRRAIDAAAELGCDVKRLLLDGWSWGGVVSLLTAAADARVRAVAAVYGAGHLYRGAIGRDVQRLGSQSAERWRDAFDPGQQVYGKTQELYLVSGSNDIFFALPDNARTVRTIREASAHLAMSPNTNHALAPAYQQSLDRWVIAAGRNQRIEWAGIESITADGDRIVARTYGPARQVDLIVADAGAGSVEDPIDWPRLKWSVSSYPVTDGRLRLDGSMLEHKLWYASAVAESGLITSTSPRVSLQGP